MKYYYHFRLHGKWDVVVDVFQKKMEDIFVRFRVHRSIPLLANAVSTSLNWMLVKGLLKSRIIS